MTTPPAPSGSEPKPYEPAREWSPSSKIDWTKTDQVLNDCLERRRLLMLHTVASEAANEGLPPIPNCPDGAAVFSAVDGNAESRFDGSEAERGVVVTIDKILDAWANGVESEIADLARTFAIENPWQWHVCRRGRLWRKRARRAT